MALPQRERERSTPAKLIAAERAKRAFELRKAGASYTQIADQLGYASPAVASQAVRRVLTRIPKEVGEDLRTVQYERLQHMMLVYWGDAMAGDTKAAALLLQIMDKLDRLMGTEAAPLGGGNTNVNAVVVVEGDSDEYIARLKEMAGLVIPELGAGEDDFADDEEEGSDGEDDDDVQDDGIIDAEIIEEG